jgi:hypothetical protein
MKATPAAGLRKKRLRRTPKADEEAAQVILNYRVIETIESKTQGISRRQTIIVVFKLSAKSHVWSLRA